MIDLNEINIKPIDGMFGFIYNGNVYIDIHSSMNILGFYRTDDHNDDTFLYSKMHKEFYSALHQLRINPDDYPIPMIQEPIKNKNGTISEYKIDLPAFVIDLVLFKIAEKKRDEHLTYYQVKSIVTKFKNTRNIVRREFDELINAHRDEHLFEELDINAHSNEHFKEIEEDVPMNNIKPNITNCKIFGMELSGFVHNGMIYLNSREAGHVIGLTRRSSSDNNKFTIRWDEYYEYYIAASASLGGENLIGIDINKNNKPARRGPKSKSEEMIPEYIPLMVVLGVANYLNNMNALSFKMDFLKYGLPFFLNNASKEDINNVNFLRNIKPLLDERERQLGIERQQQAIQQAQYMEMQYQNYIRSLQQFNQNMYYQGLRPAIPGGTANFSGMAYIMPKPEDIQKNLDSLPKHLKEVVRFEDPNKNE